jgi:uncharacterized membrane protein
LVIDPPPFVWLQGAITTGALYVAILILTTQRREDQFSTQRGQLMLELAILNDQKSSKTIELLEESSLDDPNGGGSAGRVASSCRQSRPPPSRLPKLATVTMPLGTPKKLPRYRRISSNDCCRWY